jgi:AcrR family transcriptional regulator
VTNETDGRRARSERTRKAVLDSVVALVGTGEVPTTAEVAADAGISERSLFRHFENRDGLFDAAIDRLVEQLTPLARSVPAEGPLDDRLERLVEVRAALYEAMTPMRRVAPIYARRSDRVGERMAETRSWFRNEVATTFAPELALVTGAARRDVLDELDTVLSWAAWDHLRTSGVGEPRARRLLVRSARAVLVAAGLAEPTAAR